MMSAAAKYDARAKAADSLLCVGLDSDMTKLPRSFMQKDHPQLAFNRHIIDATAEYAAAFKLNIAFYEAAGATGWQQMAQTVDYLRTRHPDMLTICDAKRGDIGNTSAAYASAIFDQLGFDAITLNPYLGWAALAPFLSYRDKASIVLCRTSNPGCADLQNLLVGGIPLWQVVARQAAERTERDNIMLVAGATYPQELAEIRQIVGEMTLLVPGVGAQGGDVVAALAAGLNSFGRGMMINSSRGIVFADDPAHAAATLRDKINAGRSHAS
ncbi:MAG: orotidine-5'-phosphate decarboxylase [Chloroflexi bacterium]|nr:orotidine-5'-phosphate decarboxylase [Chloroflexota bacterium]MCY4246672.1 orotidine-5'-phosphate decarboxylase [Chloroflexota bacterium]